MDHYGEYLVALKLVRKAQRRGDAVQAERWSKVAKRYFDARVWGDKIDREEGIGMRRIDEARLDAIIRRIRAGEKRLEFVKKNPQYLKVAPHLADRIDK
jgi:hypothetical protein